MDKQINELPESTTLAGTACLPFQLAGVGSLTGRISKNNLLAATGIEINILQYGADPTAVLDCRNAFQLAVNAARAVNGTVVIPPGNFRLACGKPIYLGPRVNISGRGGKIWVSLPDGYTNSNNYTTMGQTYTGTGYIDLNGDAVSWTSELLPFAAPWNGKNQVFHRAEGLIDNLIIDFGWGTTGAPASIRPITGVKWSIEENTYYMGFYDTRNAVFRNCIFSNAPGDYIEVAFNTMMTGCQLGDYGDHCFYMAQNPGGWNNFILTGNTVKTVRTTAIGVEGDINHVFLTLRDAFKFRSITNLTIANNQIIDENQLITAIHLEVNDSTVPPAHMNRIVISGNTVKSYDFLDCYAGRTGTTDFRIKDVRVSGNVVEAKVWGILLSAACDGFDVDGNTFIGCVHGFAGDPRWATPIKRLSFRNNTTISPNSIGIYLGGRVQDCKISNNHFFFTGVVNSSTHPIVAGNGYQVNQIPPSGLDTAFTDLLIEDNQFYNYFSSYADGGYPFYDNAYAYPFSNATGNEVYAVVKQGGALYRNTAATTGSTPPAAPWVPFTPAPGRVILQNNRRYCSTVALSPQNSSYLSFLTGDVAGYALHMAYNIQHTFNQHFNTLGDPISFGISNAVETPSLVSSAFDNLKAATLTGIGAGLLTGFNTLTATADFSFTASVSCDQYTFFPSQAGIMYVDIGPNSASGEKRIRMFLPGGGVTTTWIFSSDGYIEGREVVAPAAPATNCGRLYFEDDGAGKTRLRVRFPTGTPITLATEL